MVKWFRKGIGLVPQPGLDHVDSKYVLLMHQSMLSLGLGEGGSH